MKRFAWLLLLAALPAHAVTFTLSTYAYNGDGYATAIWSGTAPCTASSVPAYTPWSGAVAASGGQSVSPDYTVVLTLSCADGSISRTLVVDGIQPTAPAQTPTVAVSPPPSCYPPNAKNLTVGTNPSDWPTWLTAANATFAVSWYCDEKYQWKGYGFYGARSDLAADWASQWASLVFSPSSVQDAAWKASVKVGTDVQRQPLMSQIAATSPPLIVWKVKANGTSLTRPLYLFANGVRGAQSGTVAVGTTCQCLLAHSEESGGTYCAIAVATKVALCVRQ